MKWPDEMKEAWRANIPYVTAYVGQQRLKMDTSTPDGVYVVAMELYDDEELARRCKRDTAEKMKERELAERPPEI